MLSSKADLERIQAWAAANGGLCHGCELMPDVKKYATSIRQTEEGIEAASKWQERDTEDVKAWLREQ